MSESKKSGQDLLQDIFQLQATCKNIFLLPLKHPQRFDMLLRMKVMDAFVAIYLQLLQLQRSAAWSAKQNGEVALAVRSTSMMLCVPCTVFFPSNEQCQAVDRCLYQYQQKRDGAVDIHVDVADNKKRLAVIQVGAGLGAAANLLCELFSASGLCIEACDLLPLQEFKSVYQKHCVVQQRDGVQFIREHKEAIAQGVQALMVASPYPHSNFAAECVQSFVDLGGRLVILCGNQREDATAEFWAWMSRAFTLAAHVPGFRMDPTCGSQDLAQHSTASDVWIYEYKNNAELDKTPRGLSTTHSVIYWEAQKALQKVFGERMLSIGRKLAAEANSKS